MPFVKKLAFAVPFLISWYWFLTEIAFFLGDYTVIFMLNTSVLIRLLVTCLSLLAAGLFLMITLTLANGWVYVLLVVGIASILPFTLFPFPTNIALAIGTALVCSSVTLLLTRSLATYLTFSPAALLGPPAKRWATLLLVVSSFAFFLHTSQMITSKGFTLPEPLVDQAFALLPAPQLEQEQSGSALTQFGLEKNVIKQIVRDQLSQIIAPYLFWIPALLALLLFVTLQSFTSLFAILLTPTLLLLFWVMEKAGFTSYTVEMRQVRKLVV